MDAKEALRAAARARRRARSARDAQAAAVALRDVALARPELGGARRVACYCSSPSEPGTAPLRAALRAAGTPVLLPVVDGDRLRWAVDEGSDVPGYRGLPEPAGPQLDGAALAGCDVVLLPALAADATGARLGQGGGFYDRALAGTAAPSLLVAVVHDDELLEPGVIPVLPHDVRVGAVLTPSRWVRAAPGEGRPRG